MEAREVGIGNIVPFEKNPVDQLPEHYNDLANQHYMAVEQLQAIKYLYELAVNENAGLHNALNKNIQGDVRFADGFQEVIEAFTKENALLKMEITHLKNQKVESDKAAEEKDKSAQQRIEELEKVNSLQQKGQKYFIWFLDNETVYYRKQGKSTDGLIRIRDVLMMTPEKIKSIIRKEALDNYYLERPGLKRPENI